MFWFGLGVLAILLGYAFLRARAVGPLFSDDHLVELGSKVGELKARALAAASPEHPAAILTALMTVAYTIASTRRAARASGCTTSRCRRR